MRRFYRCFVQELPRKPILILVSQKHEVLPLGKKVFYVLIMQNCETCYPQTPVWKKRKIQTDYQSFLYVPI